MKKIYLLLLIALCAATSNAQVTGTKTIGVDYATIALAVTDLNTNGVGAGGATINVPAGYTENAPVGGYLLGSATLNASLSAANPLVFKKNGAGADPVITAPVGTSTTVDGIFTLQGVDYTTIDGIDLKENPANITATAAMEWGYGLVNLSATDGCNNNLIQNCTITLQKIVLSPEAGIYMNHHIAANNTALTIATVTGLNSNNKFYHNTILSCPYIPIMIFGYNAASPYTYYDQGNDVGGASAATGNTFTNFGGLVGGSFYITNYGVYAVYQNGANISYNTITQATDGLGGVGMYPFGTNSTFTCNNNTITTSGQCYSTTPSVHAGIYSNAAGTNLTANNNIISVTISGSFTGTVADYGIYFPGTGNLTATGNSIITKQGVSSALYGIYSSSATTANISSNTIQLLTTAASTGVSAGIYNSATAATGITVNNNNFNNFNINTTGSSYLVYCSNSTTNITVTGNAVTGTYTRSGASGTMYGYYDFGSPGGGTVTISNNNFSNITLSGSTAFYGIYQATSTNQIEVVSNNTISNITAATGTLIGMHHNYGAVGSIVSGNIVSGITGTGTITGIQLGNATASLGLNVFGNRVNSLSTTGASAVNGILHVSGTATNIYKNKVYDLQANNASGTVNGIQVSGGTTVTLYNNIVGDLRTPSANAAIPLSGLNISGGTTVNAYFNTVNLNALSTGALFGSAAVYASSTPTLTLRNNIFVNNSTPNGAAGYSAAYRRTNTTLTSYAAASNNNLFFAGAPCTNRLIYYDGTNADQTLAAFKTRVSTRDAASVTEDPQYTSTTGSSASFLHINPAIPTQIESGAVTIGGITDDFDGDIRGGTPDIGADEFTGIAAAACSGTPTAGTIPALTTICGGQSTNLCLSGQTAASGISIQWQSSATNGGPYTNINCAGSNCYNTGPLAPGTYYYVAVITCNNSGLSATTNQATVVVNAPPTVTVNPPAPTICSAGTGVSLTASGAVTYSWSPATGLSATSGATVTANPAATTTYTVTGFDAAGCSNTATVTVTVNPSPTLTSVGASSTLVCPGTAINLTSSGNSNLPLTTILSEGFEGGAIPAGWVSVNGGTGNLWTVPGSPTGSAHTGSKAAEYLYNSTQAASAYLITSGFALTAGTTYTISSWYRSSGATFPENLKVTVGTAQTIAAQTTTIQNVGSVTNTVYAQQSATFTPAVSGTYYFAWNCYSALDEFYLDVDDILITAPPPPPTYSWTSNPAGYTSTLQNPTGVIPPVTTIYTVTISNGPCTASGSVTVTVNNPDAIATPASQTICSASAITPIALTSSTGGTTYTWTRDNPGVTGTIGNSGAGSTISGTLINNTSAPITVTFTITPTNGGCVGTGTYTATVTVNPVPDVNQPANQTLCNNASTAPITFSGAVAGVTYNWTNNTPSIGLAASGTGNIPSFTALNATNAPVTATITVSPVTGGSFTQNFNYTGALQTFTVPAGVTSITINASGAQGAGGNAGSDPSSGSTGGKGSKASGTLTVTPGQVLNIYVGGAGTTGAGGFNGGGTGGNSLAGGGGGASDVRFPGTASTDRIIVGAGGGGGGRGGCEFQVAFGGNGGNGDGNGANGANATTIGGSAGGGFGAIGSTFGSKGIGCSGFLGADGVSGLATGIGGNGGNGQGCCCFSQSSIPGGGGGGGGYFGGGGGGGGSAGTVGCSGNDKGAGGGGAGGTSYTGGVAGGSTTTGVQTGNGLVTISYLLPPVCTGSSKTFTITVNPTPNAIATPASQSICSGGLITTIALSGAVAGTTYNWTRDNVATVIGMPASGSGNIGGTLTNTTAGPLTVTFTITPTANGCPGAPITATVLVNVPPVVSGALTQPSSCVSADGAITLTVTGAGPYGFAWTGTGVNPSSQNQTNLTVGTYNVTVTDANGCVTTASYTLLGPGGCFVCPTIGSVTTNPTPAVCAGQSVTVTASGLINMGITYGITFKYALVTTTITDIYTQGTVMGSVPNAGLTGGGTGATINYTFPIGGTYNIYAVLTPTPIDPSCRPFAVTTLTVNALPLPYAVSAPGAVGNPNPSGCPAYVAWSYARTLTVTNAGAAVTNYRMLFNINTQALIAAGKMRADGGDIRFLSSCSSLSYWIESGLNTPSTNIWVTVPSVAAASTTPVTMVYGNPSATSVNAASNVFGAGILSLFTFTEGSGTVLHDWVGGFNMNMTGTAAWAGGFRPGVSSITGFTGGGRVFLGSNGPSLNSGSFTVASFINGSSINGSTQGLIGTYNNDGVSGWVLKFQGGSGQEMLLTNQGGGWCQQSAGAIANNTWNMLGAKRNTGVINTLYVNGVSVGTLCAGDNRNVDGPGPFEIGHSYNNSYALNGNASLSVIYNVAKSDAEMLDLNNGLAPAVQPTVAIGPEILGLSANICLGSNATITLSSSEVGVNYQLYQNGNPIQAPKAGTGLPLNWTVSGLAVGTYAFTAIGTNPATGCTNPMTGGVAITVNPTPTVSAVSNQTVCNGATTAAVTFSGTPAGVVFTWVNNNPAIGLAAGGTGNIPAFTAVNGGTVPVTATITVSPSTNNGVSCTGTPITFTITVNPTAVVNAVANQVVCNGGSTTAVNFSGPVAGTVFNWTNNTPSIGLAGSGTGNIASFVAINAGTAPVVATITVTPTASGCVGASTSFTITVNPTATVNAVANQVVCNGTATAAVNFTSPTTGGTIVYNWTNNNTTIGLAAAGTGNIAPFIAINNTTGQVVATITVTPTYTNGGVSCVGTASTFTITVNPTPVLSTVLTNQVVCNGTAIAALPLFGPSVGTIFLWTNNQPSIGLGGAGVGNIPAFTATNVGTAPVVATITITPSLTLGGVTCTGPSRSFTITVNPTPAVNAIANQTLCSGAVTSAVTIAGPVPGTVYNWTNSNTSIGLAASGSGNIGAFTAINNTASPVTATITVTPVYTNAGVSCVGTATTFTITVNPVASVNGVAGQTVCAGSATTAVNFSGPVAGTVFNWTNSNTAIGLAASGTGNIPSFTATNATTAAISGTITVTPVGPGGTCTGATTSFTITVNPTVTVNAIANQTVCAGSSTAAVTPASPTAGVAFSWTNNNTSIGLGASGVGPIPSFTAVNPTQFPVTATITVTPSYSNGGITCTGTPRTFTITVNPGANIIATNVPIRVCLTDTLVVLTATPTGGVWAGPGVAGNTFNAATAGVGVKNITYTASNGFGCSGSFNINVTVNDCMERHNVFKYAIRIYPNPNSGVFNIRFLTDVYKEFDMNVIDAGGAIVGHFHYTNLLYGSVIPVDVHNLPGGYYRLEVYNTLERATFPIEILH